MKQIEVNKALCDGCGLCIVNCCYFKENEEGNAEFVSGKAIKESDLPIVEKVIKDCPNDALKLVDTTANCKVGFEELRKRFIEELEKIKKLEYPSNSSFKFKKSEYDIEWPDARGEREYAYSSYESAMSAGVKEFDRIMYSKRELIVLKIIMEWKMKYLKKFYSEEQGNYYEENNKKISELLIKYVTEINDATGGKVFFPSGFAEFNISPDKSFMKYCDKNEAMGDDVVKAVCQEFEKESYHKLSAYRDYVEADDREEYVGSGFLGDKYKTKWCYWRVHLAEKEFADDILDTISYVDIDEMVEPAVHSLINQYNINAERALKEKINILKNIKMGGTNSVYKKSIVEKSESSTENIEKKPDTNENDLKEIVKKIHSDLFTGFMIPEVIIYGYDDEYFIYGIKHTGGFILFGDREDYYRCNRNNLLSCKISNDSHVSLAVYNNSVYYHTSAGSVTDSTKFFKQNFDGSNNKMIYEKKYSAIYLDKIVIENGTLYGMFWNGITGKSGAWKERIIEL